MHSVLFTVGLLTRVNPDFRLQSLTLIGGANTENDLDHIEESKSMAQGRKLCPSYNYSAYDIIAG